jgi:hypothetical protein
VGFIGFVVAYDLAAGYYLYRLFERYERAYHAVEAGPRDPDPELTEFDDRDPSTPVNDPSARSSAVTIEDADGRGGTSGTPPRSDRE